MYGVSSSDAPASFDETRHHLDAFATLSELDRRARRPGWEFERAGFEDELRNAHKLFRDLFDPRAAAAAALRKASYPAAAVDELLSFETFARFVNTTDCALTSAW